MTLQPILEITDGTTSVNLLDVNAGWHLDSWTPAIAGLKSGGVYQDSAISEGKQLVYGVFDTVNEVFDLKASGVTQDNAISYLHDLFRLLQKAREYWTTTWQDTPVYIRAKSAYETNIRYALIHNYQASEIGNPYAQPFFTMNQYKVIDDVSVVVERGHWQSTAPGTGECTEISNVQDWPYLLSWEANLTNVYGSVTQLQATGMAIQLQANSQVFIVGSAELARTSNGGQSWADEISHTYRFWGLSESLKTGTLVAYSWDTVTYDVWTRSTNQGASWSSFGNILASDRSLGACWLDDGTTYGRFIVVGYSTGGVYYSSDDGVSFSLLSTQSWYHGNANCAFALSNGRLIVGGPGFIAVSDDYGVTFTNVWTNAAYGEFYDFTVAANGWIIAVGCQQDGAAAELNPSYGKQGLALISKDGGDTWATAQTWATGSDIVASAFTASNGDIYIGIYQEVWKSIDNGDTFTQEDTSGLSINNWFRGFAEVNNQIHGMDFNDTLNQKYSDTFVLDLSTAGMGRAATCENEVYIANKQVKANITHIKNYDSSGTSFADIFPISSFPQDLFTNPAGAGDIVYFGVDTSKTDTGPFSGLAFDIGTIASSTTSFTIVWEYYNGAWVTLTTQDYTMDTVIADPFTEPGVHSVCWEVPSDWTTVAIDSVTAYWVRARLSALSGTFTNPTQQNRDIYAINRNFVETSDVMGDIEAVARALLYNVSDKDGPGGSGPNLWSNRIVMGLRSTSRGSLFVSNLNISDTQLPLGITVSMGTNTTMGNDVQAPTGRAATYNPAGVEAMANRATITFDATINETIAQEFYGTYHAFLRVQRTAGSASDIDVQLQVSTGSGGVSKTTESVQVQTTTKFELLDFGQIRLPVAGALSSSEFGDNAVINVQASAASGTPNLVLYDLILIPTDEWSADVTDRVNESDSDIGRSGSVQKYIDIDSVTLPKQSIRALVKQNNTYASDYVTTLYNVVAATGMRLQANVAQKLYFLAAQTSTTGSSFDWISPPEISHSVQLYKNDRYLTLRGDQ